MGIYFGLLLVLEKLFLLKWLEKSSCLTQHIYALFFVSFSWPIFGFEQITDGLHWVAAMLGSGVLYDSGSLYLLLTYAPMLLLCAAASTTLGSRLYQKMNERLAVLSSKRALCLGTLADCSGMLVLCLLSMAYLVSGSYNPFLYFRF